MNSLFFQLSKFSYACWGLLNYDEIDGSLTVMVNSNTQTFLVRFIPSFVVCILHVELAIPSILWIQRTLLCRSHATHVLLCNVASFRVMTFKLIVFRIRYRIARVSSRLHQIMEYFFDLNMAIKILISLFLYKYSFFPIYCSICLISKL